jgi:hypothetical protein
MVNLPTGEILYTSGTAAAYLYTNGGGPQADWKPMVTQFPTAIERGQVYDLFGLQLNGISNGCSYGDEYYNATNYPIVRMTAPNGNVVTCRTFDHSTMGVQTGTEEVSTHVDVPATMGPNCWTMTVSAAGIMSDPVDVLVGVGYPATSFSLFRGMLVGGGLNEIEASDDTYLTVAQGIIATSVEAPVQVIINGNSSALDPCGLALQVESSVNTTGLEQSVAFWNYTTNQFDVIETDAASTSDTTVTPYVVQNVTRYIDQATGNVRAKISVKVNGPTSTNRWQVKFDEIRWIIGA